MKGAPKNVAASVRAKLLNIAERTGEDYECGAIENGMVVCPECGEGRG